MRFDVNISLAPEGSAKLGTRAEVKNLNSFRSVEKAVEYEIKRQTKILESGEKVKQETRGYSDATGETTAQRSKEEAKDYRYMPEPDIPPINLSAEFIDKELENFPLMPADYRRLFDGKITKEIIEVLLDHESLVAKLAEIDTKYLKRISNLFSSVLLAEENTSLLNDELPSKVQLEDLANMTEDDKLSSTGAKEVFLKFFDPEMHYKDTESIAKELGVVQENDTAALEAIVDKVLANPITKKAQDDYRNGEQKVIGFLVGQVMKESHGKANPSAAQKILKQKLD